MIFCSWRTGMTDTELQICTLILDNGAAAINVIIYIFWCWEIHSLPLRCDQISNISHFFCLHPHNLCQTQPQIKAKNKDSSHNRHFLCSNSVRLAPSPSFFGVRFISSGRRRSWRCITSIFQSIKLDWC
jgi:hypothetical protein